MSLLNNMLQDLQSRSAGEGDSPAPDILQGTTTVLPLPGRRSLLPWLLGGVALSLIIAIAYLLLNPAPPSTAVTPHDDTVAVAATVPARTAPVPVAQEHSAEPSPVSTAPQPPSTDEPDEAPLPAQDDSVPLIDPTPATVPAERKPPTAQPPVAAVHEAATETVTPGQPSPDTSRRQSAPADTLASDSEEMSVTDGLMERRELPPTPEEQARQALQRATQQLQAGNQHAAQDELRLALGHNPALHQARELLAGMLLSNGELDEAEQLLANGLQLAPHHSPFAMLAARLRVEQGELNRAIAILERSTAAAHNDAGYHAFLAALYQRSGRYRESSTSYRHALSLQGEQGTWWVGLAISLEGAGESVEAREAYRRALSLNLSAAMADYSRDRLRQLGGS